MVLKVRQTVATTKLLCDAREDAELDEVPHVSTVSPVVGSPLIQSPWRRFD
jgi:hypothetical protein